MSDWNRKNGPVDPGELAALLDGELGDNARAGQLSALITADGVLREEYDEQRGVKLLLGGLEEYKAPDFMATRVLAAIEQRRRGQRRLGWVRALAGGLAMFAAGFGVAAQMTTGAPQRMFAAGAEKAGITVPAGLLRQTDDYFSALPAGQIEVSDPDLDAGALEYLNLLQQAHSYSQYRHVGAAMTSPDMGSAVLVLDSQGGR